MKNIYLFNKLKNRLTENPYKLFDYVRYNIDIAEQEPELGDEIFIEIFLMVRHCLEYLIKENYNKALYQGYITLLYTKEQNTPLYEKVKHIFNDIEKAFYMKTKKRKLAKETTCLITKDIIDKQEQYYMCKSRKHCYKKDAWEKWCSCILKEPICLYCFQPIYTNIFENINQNKSKNGRVLKQITYNK